MLGKAIGFWGLGKKSSNKHFVCRTSSFHDWGYGLDADADAEDLVPYLVNHPRGIEQAKQEYKDRDVLYLVGQNDTCTDDLIGKGSNTDPYCDPSCWTREYIPPTARWQEYCYRTIMDMRCQAMLQGQNRRQRAENYMHHLQDYAGAPVHELLTVNGVGHEAERMFMDSGVLDKLFPGLVAQHDSSKCQRGDKNNPQLDPGCCANYNHCATGYKKVELGACGFDNNYCLQHGCKSIQCVPEPPAYANHDATKCRKWNDAEGCCSASGGYCVGNYTKIVLDRCGQGNDWCDTHGCWEIKCFPP
jgi:hypothetical protein